MTTTWKHLVLIAVLALGLLACTPPRVGPVDPGAEPFTEVAYGLRADGTTLVRLGGTGGTVNVTGLNDGTALLALDHRPSNGLVYALGDDGQLYTIDSDGRANPVGMPQTYGDLSEGVAFDFNPQVDAIRVVMTADGRNFVTNPTTGATNEFTVSAYAEDDENAGTMPMVAATAYDNNVSPFPEGGETVQYSLEAEANALAIQGKNMGTLSTIAELDLDFTAAAGLDISGATGTAYALLSSGAAQGFYQVDLSDGALTLLDVDASGLIDFTVVPGGTLNDAPRLLETAYGLTDDGMGLVRVGGETVSITGLNDGTMLLALDYRPSNGLLYALGSDGQLYTLNPDGAANAVGVPQTYGDLSEGVAFDFNPQVDAIRVVMTADGRNFVTNATTGATNEFTPSAYSEDDENAGTAPMVAATAYDNNVSPFPEGGETVQYSLEAEANTLNVQAKNMGTLMTVAELSVDFSNVAGLDISGVTGDAYALLTAGGAQALFMVDLETGLLTRLADDVRGLADFAIVPGDMPGTAPMLEEPAYGLSSDGMSLVRLGGESVAITGLTGDTMLIALDYRPSNASLYGLGSDGQLYTLMTDGVATAVGVPQTYGDLSEGVAFDFNPQVDAIRVVMTADGRNFVTNPGTGETNEFTVSAYAEGDEHAGTTPKVAATAYDNNVSPFPEGGETVQYSLEAEANTLNVQAKNAGTLSSVAELALDFGSVAGLDISGATGTAYALLDAGGATGLYRLDLETGMLTRLAVDASGLADFAIVPE
jgi:hypothetical protein